MTRDIPLLSVVVTVQDRAAALEAALEALVASDLPRSRWELIVVDDASADESSLVAARHADAVVRLTGPRRGPAYARNRGAEIARAAWIAFVSTDVRVRPDSLRLLVSGFTAHPEVAGISAVCGARQSASLATRYRSGRTRFTDERMREDALAFSPEFGAIRRGPFVHAGMWDEWQAHRPRSEGAEFGARLRALGYRLVVDHAVEAEHAHEWSAVSVLAADLRDPGLQLRGAASPPRPRDGRRVRHRPVRDVITVALLAMTMAIAIVAVASDSSVFLGVAGVALLLTLLMDATFYMVLCRRQGIGFALSVVPLHLASSLAGGVAAMFEWMRHHAVGDPRPHPAIEAFAEVGVNTWPPVPRRRLPDREPVR
jgi:hypothetical protein